MIYIFDIDGTLADVSHRLHYITGETKDWDAFFAACGALMGGVFEDRQQCVDMYRARGLRVFQVAKGDF